MKLGCIADDYTGATDLAGLLQRSQARVRLHFGIPDTPPDESADIEIIALKIRTEPLASAVSQALEAGRWLLSGGAERLYWKYCSTFDSTADGNIGPVASALMQLTGQRRALYCPAFPENGRSVFMGHLFVGNELLSESSLKDHPLTPMTDANLCRVLAPQVDAPVGLWSRLDQKSGHPIPDAPHVIADAVEFADLEHLIAHTPADTLLTGGSALAMPLPSQLGIAPTQTTARLEPKPKALILSGSCSQMTRRQVAHWQAKHAAHAIDPLDPEALDRAWSWWQQQDPSEPCLIYATAEPEAVKAVQANLGVAEAGAAVERILATLAQRAVDSGVRRVVVAGGETSGAVTQALGIREVWVGKEICPGVPWVFAGTSDEPIALALKSGNFGSVSFFEDALSALESA